MPSRSSHYREARYCQRTIVRPLSPSAGLRTARPMCANRVGPRALRGTAARRDGLLRPHQPRKGIRGSAHCRDRFIGEFSAPRSRCASWVVRRLVVSRTRLRYAGDTGSGSRATPGFSSWSCSMAPPGGRSRPQRRRPPCWWSWGSWNSGIGRCSRYSTEPRASPTSRVATASGGRRCTRGCGATRPKDSRGSPTVVHAPATARTRCRRRSRPASSR